MIEVRNIEGGKQVECEGQVIEITTELIEIAVHVIKKLVEGQSESIKKFHVEMFCSVLKETLEEEIL